MWLTFANFKDEIYRLTSSCCCCQVYSFMLYFWLKGTFNSLSSHTVSSQCCLWGELISVYSANITLAADTLFVDTTVCPKGLKYINISKWGCLTRDYCRAVCVTHCVSMTFRPIHTCCIYGEKCEVISGHIPPLGLYQQPNTQRDSQLCHYNP